jgi:glycosyltransferase involved in cell wall biosynthesis
MTVLAMIVVDDRSDDETPQVLAGFSASNERVKAVRVDGLPDGWLGKVRALYRGVREATGEWLLLVDVLEAQRFRIG